MKKEDKLMKKPKYIKFKCDICGYKAEFEKLSEAANHIDHCGADNRGGLPTQVIITPQGELHDLRCNCERCQVYKIKTYGGDKCLES